MASYEQLSRVYELSEELFRRTGKIAYYGAAQSAKELAMAKVLQDEQSAEKQ